MPEEVMKMKGHVTIRLIGTNGEEIKRLEQDNLIVNTGKRLALHRMGGDGGYSSEHISGILFGTSAATPNPADATVAVPPWTIRKTVTNTYPAYNQILATARLGAAEQNGVSIQELGLASTSYLFSRIVLNETINKTANFSVMVEWLISIQ